MCKLMIEFDGCMDCQNRGHSLEKNRCQRIQTIVPEYGPTGKVIDHYCDMGPYPDWCPLIPKQDKTHESEDVIGKLGGKTMKQLIKIGHGLYKVGMTRKELIAEILNNQNMEAKTMCMTKEKAQEVALMLDKLTLPGTFTYDSLDEMFYETRNGRRVDMFTADESLSVLRIYIRIAQIDVERIIVIKSRMTGRINEASNLLTELEDKS